ncbi:MAG: hypothetical protein GY779_16730, partial [Gammaproteobacteria bacterium]|nr:hypothetical protein [Gammaproteobacteria bacterium]
MQFNRKYILRYRWPRRNGAVWFYGHWESVWAGVLQGGFLAIGLGWLVVQFYALPFLMEQEQAHLKTAFRNGLFTMLAAPGYTAV